MVIAGLTEHLGVGGDNDPLKERFIAGGFLYNPVRREVLLHLRDGNTGVNPHKWAFFGGASEGNESPVETCIREWKEELGIAVNPKDLIILGSYFYPERSMQYHVFYMDSDSKKSEMVLGEGAGFDWIQLEKAFDLDLAAHVREALTMFLKKI